MQDEDVVGLVVAAGGWRLVGMGDGGGGDDRTEHRNGVEKERDGGCGSAIVALNGDKKAGVDVIEGQSGHADGMGRANTAAQRQAWADRIVGICKELVQIRDEGAEERLASGMRYEEYIEVRFGMDARTLRKYVKSYEQLGRQPELYGQLLRDMGVRRTRALSIIREMATGVFAEFQAAPIEQQQAMREQDLKGIIAQLKKQVQKAAAGDLARTVDRLKQELAAERGGRK